MKMIHVYLEFQNWVEGMTEPKDTYSPQSLRTLLFIHLSYKNLAKVKQEIATPLPLAGLPFIATAAERGLVTSQPENNSRYFRDYLEMEKYCGSPSKTMKDMGWKTQKAQVILFGLRLHVFNKFCLEHAWDPLSHQGYIKCLFSSRPLPWRNWNPI